VPPQGPITAAWHGGAALSKTSTFHQAKPKPARPVAAQRWVSKCCPLRSPFGSTRCCLVGTAAFAGNPVRLLRLTQGGESPSRTHAVGVQHVVTKAEYDEKGSAACRLKFNRP
jgi:hypothetical protein